MTTTTLFTNYPTKNVGITAVPVITPDATAGAQTTLTGMSCSNVTKLPVTASVFITRGGTDYYIVKGATVPAGGSLTVAGWDQKIVLVAGDVVKAVSSAASSIDIMAAALVVNGGAGVGGGVIFNPDPILAIPFVSGGLITLDFQGVNGAITSNITSGSLSSAGTLNLYSSNITTTHAPSNGTTSLRINGSAATPNYSARAEVTGLNIAPTPFTLEGWFYYEVFDITGTSIPVPFSIGNTITENLAIRWVNNGTRVEFNFGGGGVQGDNTPSYTIPTAGVWQHHAITADQATYRYYLDGVLITQTTSNPAAYGYGTYGYGQTAGRTVSRFAIGNYVTGQYSGLWSKLWVWNCRYSNTVAYTAPFTPVKTGMY
jgi:hypothetical protein